MHSKVLDLIVLLCLIVIVSLWWAISDAKMKKEPLNQPDAFAYRDNGLLNWFELTSKKGKIEGKLHQQSIVDEVGRVPFIDERTYSLTGEVVDQDYVFRVNQDGNTVIYDARLTDSNLLVTKRGENEDTLFKAVNTEDLQHYNELLREQLQEVLYHSEKKEKDRIKNFFNELKSYYGYVYQDEAVALLITFDEALLEGELAGSLLKVTHKEDINNQYEEVSYELNGITDGLMIKLYTTVDGKDRTLEGHFNGDASQFDATFWMKDEKITFQAVNEEEFNKMFEELKTADDD